MPASGEPPTGYSVDLAPHVVEAVKQELGLSHLEVKYAQVDARDRITLLRQRAYDIETGLTAHISDAGKTAGFTTPRLIRRPASPRGNAEPQAFGAWGQRSCFGSSR